MTLSGFFPVPIGFCLIHVDNKRYYKFNTGMSLVLHCLFISEFALYQDVMNRYFLHSYYVPDEVSFRKSL